MDKIKQIIITGIMFAVVASVYGNFGEAAETPEVQQLAEAFIKQGIEVEEWTLYTKKNISLPAGKFSENVKRFTQKHRLYNWSIERTSNGWKAAGTRMNKDLDATETLQIISTDTNTQSNSYILYQVHGRGNASKKWTGIYQYVKKQSFDIIHENPTIFSCIKGSRDDKMVGVLHLADALLNEFNAEPLEQLKEEAFVSVSAYTARWKGTIPAEQGRMNVQIAVRSGGLGENTSVVAGTPIITTEY
ncbi:YwmB family TATA-box binding protein [Metabacillus sp. 113a]|uniref:YwmB family TATA-box binding protein n=1 Tax=Metabacillus sp. 113a TaxID=3404706 RepID=UPI003CF96E77